MRVCVAAALLACLSMGSTASAQSAFVAPQCTDGQYTETLPDDGVDVSDLVAAYTPSDLHGFVDGLLSRRDPMGRRDVVEGLATGQDCVRQFSPDVSSADVVIRELAQVVHECGHMADAARSADPTHAFVVGTSLTLSASRGDSIDRGGATFARSRIRSDAFYALRPACAAGQFDFGCDSYAELYLDGDPADAILQSGDQGFDMLLEEAHQYTNALATAYAFRDYATRGRVRTSARDGVLTLLWYVQRYLHLARASEPAAYEHLLNGDGGAWRHAILVLWGRAWLYLSASDGMSELGIADDRLLPLVSDPALLDEIARLRAVECPGIQPAAPPTDPPPAVAPPTVAPPPVVAPTPAPSPTHAEAHPRHGRRRATRHRPADHAPHHRNAAHGSGLAP